MGYIRTDMVSWYVVVYCCGEENNLTAADAINKQIYVLELPFEDPYSLVLRHFRYKT